MMTWPHGPTPTTNGITWREARYLARVVQMLVTSPTDKAEFKRELEHLLRAAEALRTGVRTLNVTADAGCARLAAADDRIEGDSESAAEGAVIALWGSSPSPVRGKVEEANVAATETRMRGGGADPVDEAELARAVEEIERAAAALRAEEPVPAVRMSHVVPQYRHVMVWSQFAGLWISIAAAMVGIVAGLMFVTR
jgi:hypothetical protein